MRDPWGIRPLSLGRLDGAYVLASETCALDLIEAKFVRDIEPGEIVIINENGLESHHPFPHTRSALCIFEYIFFQGLTVLFLAAASIPYERHSAGNWLRKTLLMRML